jgi:hypothetical protein
MGGPGAGRRGWGFLLVLALAGGPTPAGAQEQALFPPALGFERAARERQHLPPSSRPSPSKR